MNAVSETHESDSQAVLPASCGALFRKLTMLANGGKVVTFIGDQIFDVDGTTTAGVQIAEKTCGRLQEYEGVCISGEGRSIGPVAAEYFSSAKPEPNPSAFSLYLKDSTNEVFSHPDFIPDTALALAGIIPLKIFITTSVLPVMEWALDKVRFNGKKTTLSVHFSPGRPQDMPTDWREKIAAGIPIVYHLLGGFDRPDVPGGSEQEAPPPESIALTEEGTLEFMRALHSEKLNSSQLFEILGRHNLLLLGDGFDDWLFRFLLRVLKTKPLRDSTNYLQYILKADIAKRGPLQEFLSTFAKSIEFCEEVPDARQFILWLKQAWQQSQPAAGPPGSAPAPVTVAEDMPEHGAIFISYASDDLEAARQINDQLKKAGIPTWMDKDRLESGDRFEKVIKRNIEDCHFFLPVISKTCLQRTLKQSINWFYLEWKHAVKCLDAMPERAYLHPVLIDDLLTDDSSRPLLASFLPESFLATHMTTAPGGVLSQEFIRTLVKLRAERTNN